MFDGVIFISGDLLLCSMEPKQAVLISGSVGDVYDKACVACCGYMLVGHCRWGDGGVELGSG